VKIADGAQIFGPAVLLDDAVVAEGALIFGPAVIGHNVTIGESSFLENCVLWDGSIVGKKCCLRNSLVDYNTAIPAGETIEDRVVTSCRFSHAKGLFKSAVQVTDSKINQMHIWTQVFAERLEAKTALWVGAIILAGVFIWSYWFDFAELWDIWWQSDEYSSGMLVPFFAFYVLWVRRDEIFQYNIQPSLWGLVGLIFAQAVRYFGLYFMYSSAERFSIVLTVASLILLLFGWTIFRKLITLLLFLCLMLPLPQSIHTAVMLPLQNLATKSAVFCLEVAGFTVFHQGNVIHLGGTTIAVAEACNGLRMITAFFVVTGFVVLLLHRPLWEKLLLLASSLPVALLCNTVRLTVTSIVFTRLHAARWEQMFHDFGGYAMMPLAIAIVMFELWLLAKLTVSSSQLQYQQL
jgi:exosortase